MTTKANKNKRPVILLDADIIGFAVATFVGTAVMAVGFFWLELATFELAVRVGLTFVVTYVATFLLVKYIVWTTLRELAERNRREYEEQLLAQQEKAKKHTEDQGPTPGQLGRN